MNQFKYIAEKNELWLDTPKPNWVDYYYAEFTQKKKEWQNRLHYSVSDELAARLKDGQRLSEKDFRLQYQELSSAEVGKPAKWEDCIYRQYLRRYEIARRAIAIPLPEQTNKLKENKAERVANIFIEEYEKFNPHMKEGNKDILQRIANNAAKRIIGIKNNQDHERP